jgi:hypothetical protein
MSQEIMDAHNGDRAEVVVPQQNTIRKALKAAKAIVIAVGGIATSLLLGTTSLASTNQIRNSIGRNVGTEVPSPAVIDGIDKKGGERNGSITLHNAARSRQETLKVEYVPPTRPVVVNTQKSSDTTPSTDSKGRLRLVNDIQSPMVIYLKGPSEHRPPRYAYLPSCTTRELKGEYTRGWRVSTDLESWSEVREISGGKHEARASGVRNGGGLPCQSRERIQEILTASQRSSPYQLNSVAMPVVNGDNFEAHRSFAKTLDSKVNLLRVSLGNGGINLRDKIVPYNYGKWSYDIKAIAVTYARCKNSRRVGGESCVKSNSNLSNVLLGIQQETYDNAKSVVYNWTYLKHDRVGPVNDDENRAKITEEILTIALTVNISDSDVRSALMWYFKNNCNQSSDSAFRYADVVMGYRKVYKQATFDLTERLAPMPRPQYPGVVKGFVPTTPNGQVPLFGSVSCVIKGPGRRVNPIVEVRDLR